MKKKRIAIVTIIDMNYGNRLQNYAMQCIYEDLGYEVETILNRERTNEIDHSSCQLMKNQFTLFLRKIKDIKRLEKWTERYLLFKKFDKNIHFSKHYISYATAKSFEKEYDLFSAGSDQIWNYTNNRLSYVELLGFVPREKSIAYAASFGVNVLPDFAEKKCKLYLPDFSAISVREASGKELIYKMLGLQVPVVLDPTLMLTAHDWETVEAKPSWLGQEQYVFVCNYGDRNHKMDSEIEDLSHTYKIIDRYENENKNAMPIGPAEFIYLIHHSECVITNSFHATVFSILFHKKVHTYDREGKETYSRFCNLAHITGLEANLKDGNEFIIENESDFLKSDDNLKQERKKSLEFLKSALRES